MFYVPGDLPNEWLHRCTAPESTETNWFQKESDMRDWRHQFTLTWGNLVYLLTGLGFADDEYISARQVDTSLPAMADGQDTVAWVMEGGNEGWYVHVRYRGPKDTDPWRLAVLGKFWDWERADLCASVTFRLLHGLPLPELKLDIPYVHSWKLGYLFDD